MPSKTVILDAPARCVISDIAGSPLGGDKATGSDAMMLELSIVLFSVHEKLDSSNLPKK